MFEIEKNLSDAFKQTRKEVFFVGSIWFSIISLFISVINLWLYYRMEKKLIRIEEQRDYDKKIKSLQADLRAVLRKEQGFSSSGKITTSYRLYIINRGETEARNIRIKLDGIPIEEHCALVKGFPMPSSIPPNDEVSYLLSVSFDCHSPFELDNHATQVAPSNR